MRRARARLPGERPAAVRLQQRPGAGDAGIGQRARDAVDVVVEQRLREGVDGHGRPALVLPPDRRHLVRERDRNVGVARVDRLAHAELVLGVQVREEQADGDGGVAVETGALERRAERVDIERRQDAALFVEPLDDAEAVPPADERRGLAPVEVVVVLAVDPLDVGDVLEAFRRQVEDPRAAPREDGVDADRRAHDDRLDRAGVDPGLGERGRDRADGIVRVRRHLGQEATCPRRRPRRDR